MKWYFRALKNYAVFNGRARRKEYWYFLLFYTLLLIVVDTVAVIEGFDMETAGNIYTLVFLIPSLSVTVRRMHDVNKSGWFCLIPFYNIILACTKGTVGPNEYGPDPKGGKLYGAEDYQRPFETFTN